MDPSFSQNPWVPFYVFKKSVGSAEPTEPTLTTPLGHILPQPNVYVCSSIPFVYDQVHRPNNDLSRYFLRGP